MSGVRLALISDGVPIPLRVTEGAATLPDSYTFDVGEANGTIAVLVGSTGPIPEAADGVLVVNPSAATAKELVGKTPLILADRWSGAELVSHFHDAFAQRLEDAKFIHVRITVPLDRRPRLDDELLEAILLLDRLGVSDVGSILHSTLGLHQVSVSTRLPSAGRDRALYMSITATDADHPEARLDAHGDGTISTIVLPARAAGSAAGSAYSVDNSGQHALPTLYADPIRAALLRLQGVVDGDPSADDSGRLVSCVAETNRILAWQ